MEGDGALRDVVDGLDVTCKNGGYVGEHGEGEPQDIESTVKGRSRDNRAMAVKATGVVRLWPEST